MYMTKKIFVGFIFIFIQSLGFSQAGKFTKYSQIDLMFGTSCYSGDLSPYSIFSSQIAKPAFGLNYKYSYNRRWTYRLGAYYGSITGSDAFAENKFLLQRNLSFSTNIYEFSTGFEFNFFPFEIGSAKHLATFYLFGGLGVFNFNPYTDYNGEKVFLQPLTTEGQGTTGSAAKAYKLTQVCMPFGLGGKVSLGKNFGLSVELGLRKLFTDYLDDVSGVYADARLLFKERGSTSENLSGSVRRTSFETGNAGKQRGFSWNNDWYSISGITLTYKIPVKTYCPGMD